MKVLVGILSKLYSKVVLEKSLKIVHGQDELNDNGKKAGDTLDFQGNSGQASSAKDNATINNNQWSQHNVYNINCGLRCINKLGYDSPICDMDRKKGKHLNGKGEGMTKCPNLGKTDKFSYLKKIDRIYLCALKSEIGDVKNNEFYGETYRDERKPFSPYEKDIDKIINEFLINITGIGNCIEFDKDNIVGKIKECQCKQTGVFIIVDIWTIVKLDKYKDKLTEVLKVLKLKEVYNCAIFIVADGNGEEFENYVNIEKMHGSIDEIKDCYKKSNNICYPVAIITEEILRRCMSEASVKIRDLIRKDACPKKLSRS